MEEMQFSRKQWLVLWALPVLFILIVGGFSVRNTLAERRAASIAEAQKLAEAQLPPRRVGVSSDMADFIVAGAGLSDWNDKFVETGTYAGNPYYQFEDKFLCWDSIFSFWVLNDNLDDGSGLYFYTGGSNPNDPSDGSWSVSEFGSAPAPTVTLDAPPAAAPTYDSGTGASVNAAGTQVTIPLTSPTGAVPATGVTGFGVKVNGVTRTVTGAIIDSVPGEVPGYNASGAGDGTWDGDYLNDGVASSAGGLRFKKDATRYLFYQVSATRWLFYPESDLGEANEAYRTGSGQSSTDPSGLDYIYGESNQPGPTVTPLIGEDVNSVVLTIAGKIHDNDTVTFTYSKASGNVEDDNGIEMEDIGETAVTNNSTAIAPPAVSATSINAAGNELTVEFSSDGVVTGSSGFSLSGGSRGSINLSNYVVSNNELTCDLSRTVYAAETAIKLGYSPGDFTDDQSNPLEAFSDMEVTNNSTMADTTSPAVASIVYASGVFTVTFTEAETPPILPATGITGFTFNKNGTPLTVADGDATGALTATFALTAGSIYDTDTLTADYDAGTGNLTDSETPPNELVTFSGTSVTNNSTVPNPAISTRTFNVVTESGTDDPIDMSASTEKGITALLSVVAASGTSPELDVVIEGADTEGGSYSDVVTFDQMTGKGRQLYISESDTAKIPQWLRIKKTVGGTDPKFAVQVVIAPKISG